MKKKACLILFGFLSNIDSASDKKIWTECECWACIMLLGIGDFLWSQCEPPPLHPLHPQAVRIRAMYYSNLERAAHSKPTDFNNHWVIGVRLPNRKSEGLSRVPWAQHCLLREPRNHSRWPVVGVLLYPFQPTIFGRKTSLWTHSIFSEIILFSNEFLVRPNPTHWNICRACPVLHKRCLKIASGYCEERTRERTRWGVSHWRPEVHQGLSVHRFRLSCASHCSCKEKATVLPEFPFPVPNGCDQQPQDPNCCSLLEIMRLPWQKPRVKATSHNTKG